MDKNVSPVGWYVGVYQIRFVELGREDNEAAERRFLVWENTVLVRAGDLAAAYDKVCAIGQAQCAPYAGGADGVPVCWVFEGVVDLLPVYEPLGDGAEIMWEERRRKLKNIRARARTKAEFLERK